MIAKCQKLAGFHMKSPIHHQKYMQHRKTERELPALLVVLFTSRWRCRAIPDSFANFQRGHTGPIPLVSHEAEFSIG